MKTWEALKLASENEGKVIVNDPGGRYRKIRGEWERWNILEGAWIETDIIYGPSGQWTVEEEPVMAKLTIKELEAILDGPPRTIRIKPDGSLEVVEEEPVELPEEIPECEYMIDELIRKLFNQIIRYLKAKEKK